MLQKFFKVAQEGEQCSVGLRSSNKLLPIKLNGLGANSVKKPFFKISKDPKPWFASFLESVAVGERTTFYLAQICLHCYFLDWKSKFLKVMQRLPLSSTGELQCKSPCSSKIRRPQGVFSLTQFHRGLGHGPGHVLAVQWRAPCPVPGLGNQGVYIFHFVVETTKGRIYFLG